MDELPSTNGSVDDYLPTAPSPDIVERLFGVPADAPKTNYWKAYFAEPRLRRDMLATGRPGFPTSPNTTVDPKCNGKTPMVLNLQGLLAGDTEWRMRECMTLEAARRNAKAGLNIGLRCDEFNGLDIDIEDADLAQAVEGLAIWHHFGPGPVREREGSNKRLIVYHSVRGSLRKHRVVWLDTKGKRHCVEFLALGQQYVVIGIHPSGKRYVWRDGVDILKWGVDELTEIEARHVEAFFADLCDLIERTGGKIVTVGAAAAGPIRRRLPLEDLSLHAQSPELVLEALVFLTNTADSFPTHDDFVRILAAIKGALGPQREEYYAQVLEWALEYAGNTEDYVHKVWDSIRDSSLGAEYLFQMARGFGFRGDAQTAAFPDNAEEANEAIGDTARDRTLKRYVWVESLGRYYDIKRGSFLDGRKFNAANVTLARFGSAGEDSAEAIFQNHPKARKVAIVTFRPGAEVIISEENEHGLRVEAVNLWRPSSLKPRFDADIAPYDDLLTRLFGERGSPEREHFLNWWAYLLQNPGKKIGHALVLIGGQGVGKDTILSPLFEAVGRHNVATIDTNTLSNQWTFYLKRQIIYAQEIITHGRRDLYNHIKPLITAQDTHLLVNEKNIPQYFVPNIQNWIFTSNHDNAIALEEDDRRFWVHRVFAEEAAPEEHFLKFRSWLAAGGSEAVYGWLLKRDVSKFNPMAKPPLTAAKRVMLDHSQPMPVRWLRDRFQEGEAFFGRTVLTVPEVQATASRDWSVPDDLNTKHVMAALKSEGFSSALRVRLSDGMRQLWVRDPAGLLRQLSADKLRERYVAETGNIKLGEAS